MLVAEWEALRHPIRIGVRDRGRLAQAATALWVFGLKQMALARVRAQHFPTRRNLKALGDRFLGLDPFWTSHKCSF